VEVPLPRSAAEGAQPQKRKHKEVNPSPVEEAPLLVDAEVPMQVDGLVGIALHVSLPRAVSGCGTGEREPPQEVMPLSSVDVTGFGAASSTSEARAAVKHVASQTKTMAPAEPVQPRALLEDALEFWLIGRKGKPTFEQFLQDPHMVKEALEEWLSGRSDLPSTVSAFPWLDLWFQVAEYREPEEEAAFLAQWCNYATRLRWRLSLGQESKSARSFEASPDGDGGERER
jgi:hypothetical protein